jgi:drug/metabolite transporter (DMT)-like permease
MSSVLVQQPPAAPHGSSLVDWVLLVLPGLIWGASFLFIADGLEIMGPNGITFFRIGIGLVVVSMVPTARRPIAAGDGWKIAALAVTWMAFPLSMFPLAEQRVSSAMAGMLNGAVPISTAIVTSLILRRPPPRGIVTGLAIGVLGGVLIAWPTIGEGRSSLVGVGLIVAAVCSYGVALNIARPLQQRHGALPIVWRALAIALVLTAPLGLPEMLGARWETGPLLSLLALGAFGTGAAQVTMTVAAGRLGATRASATTFLIPVVALALGVTIRDERVAFLSVIGCGVCLAGAWLIRREHTRH